MPFSAVRVVSALRLDGADGIVWVIIRWTNRATSRLTDVNMNYRLMAILIGVIILLGGCELLKNHKKVVKLEVKRVGIMIHDGKWDAVKKKMARGFIWETSDGAKFGRTKKGQEVGKHLFIKSLRGVPNHRNFEFVVEKVGKIDKTTCIARCEARLRINKGTDRFDTIIWQMAQTWKQSKKDKTWRLTKIKDNGPKKGYKGQIYNTNPSRKR
ncbi:MAG TPA: hypothetical protein DIT01_18165 [Lentisphaeria bacterium]|nr:hypothetical protein [Lentisphaeria bacterium]